MPVNMQGTVLVTGAAGFIGRHLLGELLQEDLAVHCLARNPGALNFVDNPRLKIIPGDITRKETLNNLAGGYDYVFHLAGHLSGGKERIFEQINVQGARNLYEALTRIDYKPKRIVHVSSMAAAGPSPELAAITEARHARPVSVYGRTKLAGERVATAFMNDLPITIVRPAVVYGPYDRNALSIYRMIERNFILIPPKQPKYYSMVHVADLAKIMIRLATQNTAINQVFNVACGKPCSWDDFIKIVSASLHRQPRSLRGSKHVFAAVAYFNQIKSAILGGKADILTPQKLPELYAQYWLVDTTKLEAAIGDFAAIDLKHGLRETADWYKANNWI